MRFRSIILTSLLAGFFLTYSGCDDFLTPEPQSFSTNTTFYQTQADFEQAINGVYVEFRALVATNEYRNIADRRGPTTTKHFDVNLPHTVSGAPNTDEFTMDPANPQSPNLWANTYDLVNQANVIITRIDDAEFEDESVRGRIRGEALTMRAFAYWFAGQVWGGVPIVLVDSRTPEEAVPQAGRSTVDAVYSQVISDLQTAIPGLPINDDAGGRITQGAAKFLLGRTFLLTGQYQEALNEFQDIDGGSYPYMLLEDSREVFDPTKKNGAESLWEVQFNPTIAGQPDLDIWNLTLPNNAAAATISNGGLLPNNATPQTSAGWLMPTPDLIESFEPGDERWTEYLAWWVNPDNNGAQEIAWPVGDLASAVESGDSIAYFFKYYYPETVSSIGESMNNWVLFRFSDVLLSAAEASWRLGMSGEAENYLNRVRARSGLGPVNLANYPRSATSGISVGDALGDAILHERLIELMGEGHAWFDIKRFGDNFAVDVMNAHGDRFKARDRKVTSEMYNVQPHMLLYPIPPNEITLASLSQNSGW